jgi:hypothetical protein
VTGQQRQGSWHVGESDATADLEKRLLPQH